MCSFDPVFIHSTYLWSIFLGLAICRLHMLCCHKTFIVQVLSFPLHRLSPVLRAAHLGHDGAGIPAWALSLQGLHLSRGDKTYREIPTICNRTWQVTSKGAPTKFLGGKWRQRPFLTTKIWDRFLEEVALALDLIGFDCAERRWDLLFLQSFNGGSKSHPGSFKF